MPFLTDHRFPIMRRNQPTDGIGASKTAVIKVPPQSTYLEWILECKIAGVAATRAQLETMLTRIRVTVSGIEKFTLTGKQLIAITEFYRTGSIADTGFLYIPFNRTWMQEIINQTGPAWGTLGESSIQIEIDQSAGSTIDTMALHTRIYPVAEPLGAHITFVKLSPTFATTGTFFYNDIPRDPMTYLYALHFELPVVANLTNIRLQADDVQLIDTTQDVMNRYLALATDRRTPQTAKGYAHIDFTSRNIDADALPMTMRSLQLQLDFANAAPNAFSIICEIAKRSPPQGIA